MSYTRADFLAAINRGIHNKIGILTDKNATANDAVRQTLQEVDLRSTRRKATLVPNLFRGEFEYELPSDLKDYKFIDIPAQAKRYDGEWTLVPTEQFLRAKRRGDVSINDYNGIRVLLISSNVPDLSVVVDPLNNISDTSGGWIGFGDGENLENETDDYVLGSGSISFDIGSGGLTTAGIQNATLDSSDFSNYIDKVASAFLEVRITDSDDITNFKLRLGANSSNYFEATAIARNDGTAFADGWNLIRFDLSSLSVVGSPDATDIGYVAMFMTKDAGKIDEFDYRFNYLVLRKGKYHDVLYYSKFGWKTAAGVYIENSTRDDDILLCDSTEFDLLVKKGQQLAAGEVDIDGTVISSRGGILNKWEDAFVKARNIYTMNNPSEGKVMISTYYDYDRYDTYGDNESRNNNNL